MLDAMRTTLDIDDDILQTIKELATSQGTTAGKVISDLARKALLPARSVKVRNGVPLLPSRSPGAARPSLKLVNDLRDDQ